MWPFRSRAQGANDAHLELVKQIHGLQLRLQLAEERIEAAEAAHERLRGRVYATGAHKGGSTEPLSKAEILAQAGFVPGRPFPHK